MVYPKGRVRWIACSDPDRSRHAESSESEGKGDTIRLRRSFLHMPRRSIPRTWRAKGWLEDPSGNLYAAENVLRGITRYLLLKKR